MLGLFKKPIKQPAPQTRELPIQLPNLQQALAAKIASYEYRQGRILDDDPADAFTTIKINGKIKRVKKLQPPRNLS